MPELVHKFQRTEKQIEATKTISEALFTLLVGGSRSGKTFLSIRVLILRALYTKSKHLIVRFKFNHVVSALWKGTFPAAMALCFPEIKLKFNNMYFFATFPNGSEIWFAGIDGKERAEKALGNEYSTIFADEVSQLPYSSLNILQTRLAENSGLPLKFILACNPPTKRFWVYKLFIEAKDPESGAQMNISHCRHLFMNPSDNRQNLPDGYIETVLESLPPRQKERFLLGNFTDDTEGALFSLELLDRCASSYKTFDELKKSVNIREVVIGVDPSTKNKEDSDLCGIVVVAASEDEKYYVIEDASVKATPSDWADAVIFLYKKYLANTIVVETNQGGQMANDIFRLKGFFGNIEEVHASQGKFARAEPVVALYEIGKVEHLNHSGLRYLEDEMTTYIPRESKKSPDRLDALVWALTRYTSDENMVSLYNQLQPKKIIQQLRRH